MIARMFTDDQELIDIAIHGLRICTLAFPIVGCQIVIGNFFQSIGRAKISIFIALTRQLLFLVPCLLIYPFSGDRTVSGSVCPFPTCCPSLHPGGSDHVP